jgi:hypothetical protein
MSSQGGSLLHFKEKQHILYSNILFVNNIQKYNIYLYIIMHISLFNVVGNRFR